MPYKTINELPEAIKKNLPEEAQRLFMKVFNSAYEKSKDDGKASQIAWGAVKKAFEKKDNKWVKKQASFEPPESGDLPNEGKQLLKEVYSDCRNKWVKEHPDDKENQTNKEQCASLAWGVVKKTFEKNEKGEWVRIKKQSAKTIKLLSRVITYLESKDIEKKIAIRKFKTDTVTLPKSIDDLPDEAQEIWKNTYYNECERLEARNITDNEVIESHAATSAWVAVKQTYRLNEKGKWVKRYSDLDNIPKGLKDWGDYYSFGRLPILSAGVHNGEKFTVERLQKIALNSVPFTPMGIGHGPSWVLAQLPEGLSHAGLIMKFYLEGDTIFGDVNYIPKTIGKKIFEEGKWTNRSSVVGGYAFDDEDRILRVDWLGMEAPADESLASIQELLNV